MKKAKLLGGLIAVAGSAIAVSTSFALFVKKDADIDITIGAKTDADVTLSVSDAKWNNGEAYKKLAPGVSNNLRFEIGGALTKTSALTQTAIAVDVTMTITANEAFVNYFTGVEATFDYSVYSENSFMKGKKATFEETAATTLTAKATGVIVDWVDGKTLPVNLTLGLPSDLDENVAIDIGGSAYSVQISVARAENYEYAYVRSTINGWQDTDRGMMVPNVYNNVFQWKYYMPKGEFKAGDEFKVHKGETWAPGANFKVTAEQNPKAVFWTGSSAEGSVTYAF